MMKKNISYIPMDHALEIWLLEKLLREPPESAYTKELLSGIPVSYTHLTLPTKA